MPYLSLIFCKVKKVTKAFTLVELMVVLAIFAVITSVVVYKYRDFNNSIILTNVAYEVGLLVRQAQVYGLSVKGLNTSGTQSFNNGYGVYVTQSKNAANDGIILFSDTNGSSAYEPTDSTIDSLKLPTGYKFKSLVTQDVAGGAPTGAGVLSIVFVRPNPNAYIKSDKKPSPVEAEMTIVSPSGKTKIVVVWKTGQISVK